MTQNIYIVKGPNSLITLFRPFLDIRCAKWLIIVISFFSFSCKKEIVVQPQEQKKDTSGQAAVIPPVQTLPVINVDFRKLGFGVDITDQYINLHAARFQVLDVDALYRAAKERFVIDKINNSYVTTDAGENVVSYAKGMGAKYHLGIEDALFKGDIKSHDSTTFRSDVIVAGYSLFVKQMHLSINAPVEVLKSYLMAAFKADLQTQTPEYIVKHYGTCVMIDVIDGARFQAQYTAQTTSNDRKSTATYELASKMDDFFGLKIDASAGTTTSTSSSQLVTNQHLDYWTIGGNASISLFGEISVGATVPAKIQIAQWQGSVTPENSELVDVGSPDGLILLSDLVADPGKSAALKSYILKYLNDNQIKMVDPPSPIYEYYDYSNGKHAYSSSKVPSVHGSYSFVGQAFQAYSKPTAGAVPVYEFYNAAKNIWAYGTSNSPDLDGFSKTGIAWYAFVKQVSGSVPCYEFYYEEKSEKRLYYDTYYSTNNVIPGGDPSWHFESISFYVYQ